jgi:peptidoglycan/LPS O-acetylase OafA/YrhL
MCVGLLLFVGPKIVLLFPIWLVGVYTYHRARKWPIGEATAWALFIGSFGAIWLYHDLGVTQVLSQWLLFLIGPHWHHELTSSQYFMGHFLLAVIMAANFLSALRLGQRLEPVLGACEKPIRFLAAYTFTLYLLHVPLIKFFATVIDGDPDGNAYYAMVMGSVFLSVLLIGTVTERRKDCARDWLSALWERAESVYARSRRS